MIFAEVYGMNQDYLKLIVSLWLAGGLSPILLRTRDFISNFAFLFRMDRRFGGYCANSFGEKRGPRTVPFPIYVKRSWFILLFILFICAHLIAGASAPMLLLLKADSKRLT